MSESMEQLCGMDPIPAKPRPMQIRIRTTPDPIGVYQDPKQGFDTEVVGVDEFGNEYGITCHRVEFVAEAGKTVNVAKLWVVADIDATAVVTDVQETPNPGLSLGEYAAKLGDRDGDVAQFDERYRAYGDLYKRKSSKVWTRDGYPEA